MGYGVCVRIRGEGALFTRPECEGERMSYECLTPSAARGILEAVFWHPSMRYRIDRITVLNPIRFASIRRNEVGSTATVALAKRAYTSGAGYHLDATADRQQRASVYLIDVDYLVDAHFELVPVKAGADDTPEKFYNMLLRRLRKGQHFAQPVLGCREFAAQVELVEGERPRGFYADTGDYDMGLMLYDVDYENGFTPIFFHAVMHGGEIAPEVST